MQQRRITLGYLAWLGLVALGLFAWVGLAGVGGAAIAAAADGVPADDRPRFAALREKFKDELWAMDRYRRESDGYRDRIGMPAARKFFAQADLMGLHQATIEALLGPLESPRHHYVYMGTEVAVIREIVYDDARRVREVKMWPSQ